MTGTEALLRILRCPRTPCVKGCPMRQERQVEQDLYSVRCAAHDAADAIERLERDARRWEQLAQQLAADRGGIWPTFMETALSEEGEK